MSCAQEAKIEAQVLQLALNLNRHAGMIMLASHHVISFLKCGSQLNNR